MEIQQKLQKLSMTQEQYQQDLVKLHNCDELFCPQDLPMDKKNLKLENYLDLDCNNKVKNQVIQQQFVQKIYLFNKYFSLDFQSFWELYKKIFKQSTDNDFESFFIKINQQSYKSTTKSPKDKQYTKSYTKHTKKQHELIFISIRDSGESNQRQRNLRFYIFSDKFQILHIFCYLQLSAPRKMAKFLLERFTKLQTVIFVNIKQKTLQLCEKLQKQIKQHQKNPDKFNSLQNKQFSQQWKSYSNDLPIKQGKTFIGGIQDVQIINKYYPVIISSQNMSEPFIRQLSSKAQSLQMFHQSIESTFVNNKCLDQQMLNLKQINSIFSLYFNMALEKSSKSFNFQTVSPKELLTQTNEEIKILLTEAIQNYQTPQRIPKEFFTQHYGPSLSSTCKKCIVCRQRKAKYGCQRCAITLNVQIHLCFQTCFRKFHQNPKLYLSKIKTNNLNQMLPQSQYHPKKQDLTLQKSMQVQPAAIQEQINQQIKQVVNNKISYEEKYKQVNLQKYKKIRKKASYDAKKYHLRHKECNDIIFYQFMGVVTRVTHKIQEKQQEMNNKAKEPWVGWPLVKALPQTESNNTPLID